MKTPTYILKEREEELIKYLGYVLRKRYKKKTREQDKRGREITINRMARNTKMTYSQARGTINRLVECGIVEKWCIFEGKRYRRNFYRLKVSS